MIRHYAREGRRASKNLVFSGSTPIPRSPITDSGIARIDVSDFHSKLTEYTTPSPLLFRPQLSRR